MYPKSGVSLCLLLSPYVMVLCSCAHAALPNSNSAITYRLEGVRPNPLEPPLRTPLQYHDETNSEHFLEWFQKLLVNVQPGSVIVLDNAPYHNSVVERVPTKSSRKKKCKSGLQEWLTRKRIPFSDKDILLKSSFIFSTSLCSSAIYATQIQLGKQTTRDEKVTLLSLHIDVS